MSKIEFPYRIKRGSAIVTIYRAVKQNGYESFTVRYYQDGMQQLTRTNFKEAKAKATEIAVMLASEDSSVLSLTNADVAAYRRARQHLDPVGVSIELAAAEFSAAKIRLGDVPLAQAVDFYLKRHRAKTETRTVAQVVTEMLAAKEAYGLSDRYVKCLKSALGKFSAAFHCNIGTVAGYEINDWLLRLKLAPKTHNNIRGAIGTLFAFAVKGGFLPKDHDEIDSVVRLKDVDGEIEIWTPDELAEILNHAGDELVPFFAINAFAGVRPAEIQRLDWNDIDFESKLIKVPAKKAKTASRRTPPVLECLMAWLLPLRQTNEPVCSYACMSYQYDKIERRINNARRQAWARANGIRPEQLKETERRIKKFLAAAKSERQKQGKRAKRGELPPAGGETAKEEGWTPFAWKHNAHRHSFVSYRLADIQNFEQVAYESGNSRAMILKHYREVVTPTAAKKWFSIVPQPAANVVELKPQAAAA